MADSPEIQAADKRYKAAIQKQFDIHQQTNDPAQHKKAEDEVHDSLTNLSALMTKSRQGAAPAAGAAPKSAWEMLTGR